MAKATRPRDLNQRAKQIVDIATGQANDQIKKSGSKDKKTAPKKGKK